RPARASYIRDLVEAADPGNLLPAAVSPAAAPDAGAAPVMPPGAGGSWRSSDPTLTFDGAGARPGYHEFIVGGAYRGRVGWWATGDFDGDGLEDAVLFLNLAPTG